MINLVYLDDDNNVIEEMEEINYEKDYKLDKLYLVSSEPQSQLMYLQSLTNTFDFQMTYNLNHSDYSSNTIYNSANTMIYNSANTIYTTSESNILIIQSKLIEHLNVVSKDKIKNTFHALKDNSTLSVFLEKRELVIEKKEQLFKKISDCKTLSEILNNIYSINDLNLIN